MQRLCGEVVMKTMRWAALAALALAGCRSVGRGARGSGTIEEQVRQVDPFAEVEASGAVRVRIQPGAQRVVVRTDGNLLDRLRTEVHAGKLSIHFDRQVEPSRQAEIEISA